MNGGQRSARRTVWVAREPEVSSVENKDHDMAKASVIVDKDFVIGEVDPRLFGGFAEHLGRHIYTGMYEPGHATADEQGFRKDVLELVRELDMPVVRYPGGNYVSGHNWEDALCVGGMLLSLLNHADRVKIGCLAQIVNVIAPILTQAGGPAWRQTIFYPVAQASRWGRGMALRPLVTSTLYDAANGNGFPHLKLAAIQAQDGKSLTLFALNRSVDEPLELTANVRGYAGLRLAQWMALRDGDLTACNTLAEPSRVIPVAREGAVCADGRLQANLPPASWNVIRLLAD
jgi:alpha-L-arabinofuranosidase